MMPEHRTRFAPLRWAYFLARAVHRLVVRSGALIEEGMPPAVARQVHEPGSLDGPESSTDSRLARPRS
jgi:hypothetical protein